MASIKEQLYKKNSRLLESLKSKKHIEEILIDVWRCLEEKADVNTTDEDGYTPLHVAVRRAEAIIVNVLLERGADVNTQDKYGNTPLHDAVFSKETSIVELLLNKGADVNAQVRNDDTPLHIAARYGMTSIIELLLNKGADVNAKAISGYTPLHASARSKKTFIVELLLNKGADVNAQTTDGYTRLHMAAHIKETSVIKLLLTKGADVNLHTTDGYTPLHMAVRSGVRSIVKLLLDAGADVNAQAINGCTPLLELAHSKETSIAELLLSKGADVNLRTTDGYTPLHMAVRSGVASIVKLLLDAGVDVNAQAINGCTPLLELAHSKETSIAELLLSKGADVNAQTVDGYTLLHEAARSASASMVEFLLSQGADINALSTNKQTPLYAAAGSKQLSVVELLLNNGANVNNRDTDGHTPLHVAACSGILNVLELMLNKGADVNALARNKVTPLHGAVHAGEISKVELLLNKGAYVNAQKTNGDTPLHMAVRKEDATLVTLLLCRGADVMLKNKMEGTPLSYALLFSLKHNTDIVSLLQTAVKEAGDNALLNNYYRSNPIVNPRDIFQINGQDMIPNNSIHSDEVTYLKTTDTYGLPGQLYETKLLSLVFLRVLNQEQIEHNIFLGVNVNGIGAMDDICLRYRVRDRQQPVVLFMQVKHREDPENGKITDEALWSDTGDFSLWKYFKSYLMIKNRFQVGNKDPMFEGQFSEIDCYLVLYTSVKESLTKKKTENKVSDILHDLVNTRQNTEPFQYSYDETDLDRLAKVATEARIDNFEGISFSDLIKHAKKDAKGFFSSLWFYSSQAKQNQVESIVKYEINKHYNNNKKDANNFKFELHSNAIFLKVHNEIQEWWKLKDKAPYLSRSSDFFTRAKLECLADVLLIVFYAKDYLKLNLDLKFNHYSKQCKTSVGSAVVFNTILCKLFRIINPTNLFITLDMDFKNEIVTLLLSNNRLEGKSTLPSDRSQNLNNWLKSNILETISNNDMHINEPFQYSKRAGTSGAGGALFRMKLLCLVLLRVLHHDDIKQDPQLGTKIRGISFMNDICLRYQVKGQQKPVVLFVQLIHREDPEKGKLTDESLWSDFGDFSLRKYYKSYLMIKQLFRFNKEDPFKGEFRDIDCYFILYTSAKENLSKKITENKASNAVTYLINTRQKTEPFQYDYNEADIDCLINVTAMDQINTLGTIFLESILSEKYNPNLLTDKLIARYHVALGREVLQQCELQPANKGYRTWEFRSEFFNSDIDHLVRLKKIFVKIISSKRCDQRKISNESKQNFRSDNDREKLQSLKIKLPLSFGNLDMTFRGNEAKVRKRVKLLANKLVYLLEFNRNTKIVEINDGDVGPGKTIEQGIMNINGGIGSAVGNLLVLETESNMLKFDLENKALPYNAALLLKELKDNRFKPANEDLSIYRLKININDFPKYSFNVDEYDTKQAKDFLSKFWFYSNQAKEDEVERILKAEINKIYSDHKIRYNHNIYRNISDSLSLFCLDDVQKWWLQTNESPYLSRASELFERAQLADIYNLLQTVINYMYISNIDHVDLKVKRVNIEKSEQMQQYFKKISGKLFNLFDPQFNESFDFKLAYLGYKTLDTLKLCLRIHPQIEWVALILVAVSEEAKYRIVAKAGPSTGCRRAKDGFMIYEHCFLESCCISARDCLNNIFVDKCDIISGAP